MALPNGTSKRIRVILERKLEEGADDTTAAMIAVELGLPTRTVSNALTGMAGVFRNRPNHAQLTTYSLRPYETAAVTKRKKNVVSPPYREWRTPELTLENYDIYAGRNLAMLAR